MTAARHRVAHEGTGLTGREALGAIIDDPLLELVGVIVSTEAVVPSLVTRRAHVRQPNPQETSHD